MIRAGLSKPLLSVAVSLILCVVACQSVDPTLMGASKMTLWDLYKGKLGGTPNPADSTLWRYVDVEADGSLDVAVVSESDEAEFECEIFNESKGSSLASGSTGSGEKRVKVVSTKVAKGRYYISLASVKKPANFSLEARFVPADAERKSGQNKTKEGAQSLRVGDRAEASVSVRDANQTDWYVFEGDKPGEVRIRFDVDAQSKGLRAEVVDEKGIIRILKNTELIEIGDKKVKVWVRVFATEASSIGKYTLSSAFHPLPTKPVQGVVLRNFRDLVTIDLGTEQGVKEGTIGVIKRSDGSLVEFKVEKALRRTSNARVRGDARESDVGRPVRILGESRN